MKPENNYRISIEKRLPQQVYHCKMANPYTAGIFDSWYSGDVGDLWIEWKWLAKLPAREDTVIVPTLSPLQLKWGQDRTAEGRNVWVVVGAKAGGHVFRVDQCIGGVRTRDWALLPRDQVAEWIAGQTLKA